MFQEIIRHMESKYEKLNFQVLDMDLLMYCVFIFLILLYHY